jgi:hypothetical protein
MRRQVRRLGLTAGFALLTLFFRSSGPGPGGDARAACPPWRTVLDVTLTSASSSDTSWHYVYTCAVQDYSEYWCEEKGNPAVTYVQQQVRGSGGGSCTPGPCPPVAPPSWPPPANICCRGFNGVCSHNPPPTPPPTPQPTPRPTPRPTPPDRPDPPERPEM